MIRVRIDSYSFDDPRFGLLAEVLGYHNRWQALGQCLRVWHYCAGRQTTRIRALDLAVLLDVRNPHTEDGEADAIEAFVDIAGLGERLDDDSIRVLGISLDAMGVSVEPACVREIAAAFEEAR